MSYDWQKWKFRIILGARGLGKTYSTWRWIIKRWIKNKEQFVWLRVNESATKKMLAKNGLKLIPPRLLVDYGIDVITRGGIVYFNGKMAGQVMALSTFASTKGSSFDNIKNIVLDELNREKNEKNDLDMAYAFYNQIETICRLDVDKKVVLLGNTIEESSEILGKLFGFVPQGGRFGLYKLPWKRAIIHYAKSSEEFEEQRDTSLSGLLLRGAAVDKGSMVNEAQQLGFLKVREWSKAVKPRLVYRIWFTPNIAFDYYKLGDASPYVVGVDKHPNKAPKNVVFNPNIVAEGVPYIPELVKTLREIYLTGRMVFENQNIAMSFRDVFESVCGWGS